MKNSNDKYRQFLDEVESMIENEKRIFRELKEILKDSFTDKSIPELLKKRRRAYDHALVECINKNGFGDGNIRNELDNIWEDSKIRQPALQKFLRPLKVLNPFGLLGQTAAIYFDDTYKLKKKQWHAYLNASLEMVKRLGRPND